ncbi:MAG: MBL fold metallo-hydrolase, partial [candidate division Zixibacteria bacterium]|nr:MBL fold metallo-hydrolase [candidate division Zixibacteria bacterium]
MTVKNKKLEAPNRIKFLGTAGARIVVAKQLRASGGIWLSLENKNFLVDPGPGTLVKCHSSKPKLDPSKLDAIILTHRHIDHSNDVNIMIEAMTEGGFKRRGMLFCPADALNDDPVVLKY